MSVTSPMRMHGWNVHFLATPSAVHFAGLLQLDGSNMVSFRDALAELRLCFDLPGVGGGIDPDNDDSDSDPWSNIGFSFAGVVNPPPGDTSVSEYPTFVHQDLDQPVPTPPPTASTDQEERPILRFHIVRHTSCSLPPSASLASHIQGLSRLKHVHALLR